jgi:cell division protein FtsI/penicillin-binding protein 2
LYKYQLKDKKNRWTRTIPFKKAFAFSNNVVFGKAAIKNSNFSELSKMANRFGFNKDILQMVDTGSSKLLTTDSNYELAELASGFNRETMISPIHGAIIASVVANDGLLRKPTVIDSVRDSQHERLVWKPKFEIERVLTKESNETLQNLMELTVKRGTARGAFRPWKIKNLKNVDIGGKTGTITGGVPYGRRDWFVSYAVPKDENDKGISVCVMTVNVKKWYIKSTVMAKKVINHYYTKINHNH